MHSDAKPHFETAVSFEAARALVTFIPLEPKFTAGHDLQSIRVLIRDHKLRDLPIGRRTIDASYGGFSFSQSSRGVAEARRLALDTPYGPAARVGRVAGHEARIYELGPEVAPDDIDGRRPAVVAWHDGDQFFLIASDQMPSDALLPIATSIHTPPPRGNRGNRGRT